MSSVLSDIISPVVSAFGIGSTLLNNQRAQENYNEQMNFARYQYEDMKRFNSIDEQVKRMRKAGINPALLLGQGQLGTASSSVSNPSSPSFDSVSAGDILTGFANMQQAKNQELEQIENANRLAIDNQTRSLRNRVEILNLIKEFEKRGLDTKLLQEELSRSQIDTKFHTQRVQSEIRLSNAQSNYYDSQELLNNEYLNWVPQEKKAQILVMQSQHFRNYAEGRASLDQARAAIRNSLKQNGIFFESKDAEKEYLDACIDAMTANGYLSTEYGQGTSVGPKGIEQHSTKREYYNPRNNKHVRYNKGSYR